MGTKTEAEAKASSYELFIAPRPYSFELNNDMIELLRQEFNPQFIVSRFEEAIAGKNAAEVDQIAQSMFTEYGRTWMKRVLQLGEEYPDRTYEMLKEAVDKTGELVFPLVVQRFVEIAYLSTHQLRKLPIVENWSRRLVYQVPDCVTFKLLKEKCGDEVAGRVPCRHGCLSAARTACEELNVEATVKMETSSSEDGLCQFVIIRV